MKKFKRISLRLFKTLPARHTKITFSTVLTLARIVLTPFIVGAMVTGRWGMAFWLFIIAAITDVLDGNVARLLNQKTFLGACLDPIADKLLMVSCFTTLAFVQSPLFTIPLWFVAVVLIKELVLIVGSVFLFLFKGHLEVEPTILGKATTFVQVAFIMWLFACYFFYWMPIKTYYTMLSLVVVLEVGVFAQYTAIGISELKAQGQV